MNEIDKYLDTIIHLLEGENFFERAGIFMDRDILAKFLTETITENYEKKGSPLLEPNQLHDIIERVNHFIIEETMETLVKDGLINIVGMNEDGEFIYKSSDEDDNLK
jgi:hypothetical protein